MNDDNKWVCASNCVFTGTVAMGDVLGGNNKTIDMATDEEKESVRHGEYTTKVVIKHEYQF